jgi:hypothetical protein
VLLDQLGRGLRILQGGLYDRMRLEELLRQDRLLQDGLQERVLLHELARLLAAQLLAAQLLAAQLLALGIGAEGLRTAWEAAGRLPELRAGLAAAERAAYAAANAAADGPAQRSAEAAAEALWLKLLLSGPELLKLSHVRLLVDEYAADEQAPRQSSKGSVSAEGLRRRDQRSHKRVRYRGLDRGRSMKFVGGTPWSVTFAVAHGGRRLPLRPGGQPGNTRPHRVE